MEFDGIVAAVADPDSKVVSLNGEQVEKTRLRVVSESGRAKPVTQEDGSTRNERRKSYFTVEAWGGQAKALQALNKGEKVHLGGEIVTEAPFKKADGSTFYPEPTLRVNKVEFIGANPAASRNRASQAIDGVRAANNAVAGESIDADMSPGREAETIGF